MVREYHSVQIILMHNLDMIADAGVFLPLPLSLHLVVDAHGAALGMRVESQCLEVGDVVASVGVGARLRCHQRIWANGVLGDHKGCVVGFVSLQVDGLVVLGEENHEVHA